APVLSEKYVGAHIQQYVKAGQELVLVKYAVNLSTVNHPKDNLLTLAKKYINRLQSAGYGELKARHTGIWERKWQQNDIVIEGDRKSTRLNSSHVKISYA